MGENLLHDYPCFDRVVLRGILGVVFAGEWCCLGS